MTNTRSTLTRNARVNALHLLLRMSHLLLLLPSTAPRDNSSSTPLSLFHIQAQPHRQTDTDRGDMRVLTAARRSSTAPHHTDTAHTHTRSVLLAQSTGGTRGRQACEQRRMCGGCVALLCCCGCRTLTWRAASSFFASSSDDACASFSTCLSSYTDTNKATVATLATAGRRPRSRERRMTRAWQLDNEAGQHGRVEYRVGARDLIQGKRTRAEMNGDCWRGEKAHCSVVATVAQRAALRCCMLLHVCEWHCRT